MNNITDILKSRGVVIDEYVAEKCDVPPFIINLSRYMAENHDTCVSFMKYMKNAYSVKNATCRYTIPSNTNRNKVIELARMLNKCGIISDLAINDNHINGEFSFVPKITNFVLGDYLEIYATDCAIKAATHISKEQQLDFEVISNVKVHKERERHELDLLIRVSDLLFWCEVKSGSFSTYKKYYNIGKWLEVNPNMHILLSAEADSNISESASYFYSFYVSNAANFRNSLETMIRKALKEAKNVRKVS